jgi:hypothetical protein
MLLWTMLVVWRVLLGLLVQHLLALLLQLFSCALP